MILSDDDKAAITQDPSYIAQLYANEGPDFALQLEPQALSGGGSDYGSSSDNADGALSDPLLAAAFASECAYELKPYGNELPGVVDLQGLLAQPTLACDDYVRLAMWLMQQLPQCQSLDVAALGWDNGVVGDHAQLLVSDGNETLLLDPTIGMVVRNTSYNNIVTGVPTTDYVSFFTAPSPDPWQLVDFNKDVTNAVQDGLYKPSDAAYYYTFNEFNIAGASLTQAETTLAQKLINAGIPSSPTPYASLLSFIKSNTNLFESAASAVAEEPALQNEAMTATSVQEQPLKFSLRTGAQFMGLAIDNKATTLGALHVGANAEFVLGSIIVLGGLAGAYDDLNDTGALQNIENSLTPRSLRNLVASIT